MMEERFVTVGEERVLLVGSMSIQAFLRKLIGNIHPVNWTVKINGEPMSQVDLGRQVEEGDSFSVSVLTWKDLTPPDFITSLELGQKVEVNPETYVNLLPKVGTVDRIKFGCGPYPVIVNFEGGRTGKFKWCEVNIVEETED